MKKPGCYTSICIDCVECVAANFRRVEKNTVKEHDGACLFSRMKFHKICVNDKFCVGSWKVEQEVDDEMIIRLKECIEGILSNKSDDKEDMAYIVDIILHVLTIVNHFMYRKPKYEKTL